MRLLAALALVGAVACAGPAPCPVAPAPGASGPPWLWRVEGPAGAVVWLYGTLHDAGAEAVPAVAWAALRAAPRFASELGDAEPDPDELREVVVLPRGPGLDQRLPPDRWWDLRDALRGAIREDELARVQPWYAMSLLTRQLSPPPDPTMDVALTRRARALGKPVDALERHADQLGALVAAVGVADLVEAIDARRELRCELARNRAAYVAGDQATVERVFGADRTGRLLAPRNRRWLPAIEAYLHGGGAFVAVGVGHLVGRDGLPAMLARAGYRVERGGVR